MKEERECFSKMRDCSREAGRIGECSLMPEEEL